MAAVYEMYEGNAYVRTHTHTHIDSRTCYKVGGRQLFLARPHLRKIPLTSDMHKDRSFVWVLLFHEESVSEIYPPM
jgi:hypothetical protein